jgi:hypothetical protein
MEADTRGWGGGGERLVQGYKALPEELGLLC